MSGKNWSTSTSHSASGGSSIISRAGSSVARAVSDTLAIANGLISQGQNYVNGAQQAKNNAALYNNWNLQNEYNLASARQAQNFSAAQAQAQMNFQERMSNTSYQRAVADMKAAGLNPSLLMGGASTPSGASATGVYAPSSAIGYDYGNHDSLITGLISALPSIAMVETFGSLFNSAKDFFENKDPKNVFINLAKDTGENATNFIKDLPDNISKFGSGVKNWLSDIWSHWNNKNGGSR